MEKHYLTKESSEKLLKELEERKFKIRKEISERIRESKEFGDLSENASYKEVREEESFNEARIEQLEAILRESVIVQKPHLKSIVEIGDKIELQGGLSFTLVDSQQTNPPEKISVESPLGQAIIGKKVGDVIKVKMPNGNMKEYKIVKVS